MKKYEYKFIDFALSSMYTHVDTVLNQLGSDGWDMIASYKIGDHRMAFVFKRTIKLPKMPSF